MQLTGQCTCGAVTFEIDGEPEMQLYCHCHSCQTSQAAPLVAVALFQRDAIKLAGETRTMTVTDRDGAALRISCARCGARVANVPSGKQDGRLMAIFPALIREQGWFSPSMHIFCGDRTLLVDDALPKYVDVPAEFGGSGAVI